MISSPVVGIFYHRGGPVAQYTTKKKTGTLPAKGFEKWCCRLLFLANGKSTPLMPKEERCSVSFFVCPNNPCCCRYATDYLSATQTSTHAHKNTPYLNTKSIDSPTTYSLAHSKLDLLGLRMLPEEEVSTSGEVSEPSLLCCELRHVREDTGNEIQERDHVSTTTYPCVSSQKGR